jgi:hypothetical protein
MIRVIRSTLRNATGKLHVDAEVRDVPTPDGSGQGTILGPLLCDLFLLPLISTWIEKWCHHSTVFDDTKSFSHTSPTTPASFHTTSKLPLDYTRSGRRGLFTRLWNRSSHWQQKQLQTKNRRSFYPQHHSSTSRTCGHLAGRPYGHSTAAPGPTRPNVRSLLMCFKRCFP